MYRMANDPIKRAVVGGGVLHLVRGSGVWSVKAEDGKEPNEWKSVHFANIGTSEEFIEVLTGEILELVDGSQIFLERDAVKGAIMTVVMEGLMPAFEHLKKIRLSITNPMPEMNRRQLYEDFSRTLWHAYKDLFPKAVQLLGFKIGFMFQDDEKFEKGLSKLTTEHPSLILDVPELLRRQRANWQAALQFFRNDFLEHRKVEAAEVADFYKPGTAEILFDHAWRTMAELFPAFIEAHFPPNWSIMQIPVEQRNPAHPRRWRPFPCETADRGKFAR